MIKSVCIAYAHGCIRAEAEIELLAQYFTANGLVLKDEIADADLVMVSSCGFDLCAENTSMKLLRKAFQKKNELAQMAVVGCLPAINRRTLLKMPLAIRLCCFRPRTWWNWMHLLVLRCRLKKFWSGESFLMPLSKLILN